MYILKKIFFSLTILFALQNSVLAELPHYLDFKFILNESTAGKKAQNELKKKLDSGLKSIRDRELKIQQEEKKI